MFVPSLSSRAIISGSFARRATSLGVPSPPTIVMSAPCSSSSSTSSARPFRTAKCSGVSPYLEAADGSGYGVLTRSECVHRARAEATIKQFGLNHFSDVPVGDVDVRVVLQKIRENERRRGAG